MSRRALLRGLLGAVTLGVVAPAALLGTFTVAKAAPGGDTAGAGTVRTWRWVTLPGTTLQVYLTTSAAGAPTSAAVTWTGAGVVSALGMTVAAPAAADGTITMTMSPAGAGLSVRRVAR